MCSRIVNSDLLMEVVSCCRKKLPSSVRLPYAMTMTYLIHIQNWTYELDVQVLVLSVDVRYDLSFPNSLKLKCDAVVYTYVC